jgi:hypothetical protein
MENGAKGCEVCLKLYTVFFLICGCLCVCVFWLFKCLISSIFIQVIVSGKLRAQRAKSMKFKDGYMISSGQPVNEYIDSAVRHVLLRQVSLGPSSFLARFCIPIVVLGSR